MWQTGKDWQKEKRKRIKNILWLNVTKLLLDNNRKNAVSFSSSCPGTVKHITYVYFDKTTALYNVIMKRMWLRLSGFKIRIQKYHKIVYEIHCAVYSKCSEVVK